MKQRYFAAALILSLLLTGCASSAPPAQPPTPQAPPVVAQPTEPTPETPPPVVDPLPAKTPESHIEVQTSAEGELTVFHCAGIDISLPTMYLDQLIVVAPRSPKNSSGEGSVLFSVSERASVEALIADYGDNAGGGLLFSISRMNQNQYEQYIMYDTSGRSVFARDEEYYYSYNFPTDVQFYRSGEVYQSSAEWAKWEALSDLGDDVMRDCLVRNELQEYSDTAFYNQPFTYEGEHVFIKYYPYYSVDGSTDEFYTLILSQPGRQGEGGLWCVERMIDEFGTLYIRFPVDIPFPAADYYTALQIACDAGSLSEFLTPQGAASYFVQNDGWFYDIPVEGSFEITDSIDSDYTQSNLAVRDMVSSLVSGKTLSEEELISGLRQFGDRTWGVLGRHFYGSDWWPSLRDALESVSSSADKAEWDRAMMDFYLRSYGTYARDIAEILVSQRNANTDIFASVLAEFPEEDQAKILQGLAVASS